MNIATDTDTTITAGTGNSPAIVLKHGGTTLTVGNVNLHLFDMPHLDSGSVDAAIQPTLTEVYLIDEGQDGEFVSVTFDRDADRVKGFMSVEQATKLRDQLNEALGLA